MISKLFRYRIFLVLLTLIKECCFAQVNAALSNPIELDLLIGKNINCISSDHKGRMWLGKDDGLFIYDGYSIIELNAKNKLVDLRSYKIQSLNYNRHSGNFRFIQEHFSDHPKGLPRLQLQHLNAKDFQLHLLYLVLPLEWMHAS